MYVVLRAWLLAAVVAASWFLSVDLGQPHRTLGTAAAAAAFSSARAQATLARVLGPEKPHPLSSAENAAVRARVLKEFAALGARTRIYQAFTCNAWRGFGFIPCATVSDIIAEVVPGPGRAIVMMAHYDSVPAGPGAADDEAGVAAVLETARALRAAATRSLHPVIALISDGEEQGLLGANAFLQNPELKASVGAVVNAEARGTRGSSLLFQTSAGDGRLIDLYATHVAAVAASSLYPVIYRYLPNDTDLTLFLRDGFPAYNFAFADNVRYYHSPLDLRRNLSAGSLQMQGDSLLGVVGALEQTPYLALKGSSEVYLSVFNIFVPRLAVGWSMTLAIAALLALALAVRLARAAQPRGAMIRAAFFPLALLVGALMVGYLLTFIAVAVSGMPDPTYAYPTSMRIGLAFGLWGVTLAVSRMTDCYGAAASAWLWLSGVGIVAAALLPGVSPYFVFPSAIAAVGLLATARGSGRWGGRWGQVALFIGALAALIIWIGLLAAAETLLGLRLHPLVTLPAAVTLMTLVPLLAARPMGLRSWRASLIASAAVSLGAAVIAGLLPAYSAASPQRLNLIYLEDQSSARWIVDSAWKAQGAEPISPALLKADGFELKWLGAAGPGIGTAYVAAAGAARFPLPTATVIGEASDVAGRRVTLQLQGSSVTDEMILYIPAAAKLQAIEVRGQRLNAPPDWSGNTRLVCASRDCRDERVTLTLGSEATALEVTEERYGLPAFGAFLAAARPKTAMASQNGDQVILSNTVQLP